MHFYVSHFNKWGGATALFGYVNKRDIVIRSRMIDVKLSKNKIADIDRVRH